jgi:starvation-inducible DNA-binding protein
MQRVGGCDNVASSIQKEPTMGKSNGKKSVTNGIGLTDKTRKTMVDVLNRLLADEFVLYVKTRNFHWNVTGPNFSELHKFFEAQYEALDDNVDEIAERARALDGMAAGSMTDFLKLARLPESSSHVPAPEMLRALLADHEQVIRQLRADIEVADDVEDVGTEDFLTGLMEGHEKTAWMLRAYVK